MGFKGGIQSSDIANLGTRSLWLRFSSKKITIENVTQCIERPVLVEDLLHVILNGDMAVTQSKEILQNVLN